MLATDQAPESVAPRVARTNTIQVLVRSGAEARLEELPCGKVTIGSSPRCNIRIQVAGVHPLHCVIVHDPDRLAVRRWASETLLNGVPFDEAPLTVGDRLTVGPAELEVMACVGDETPPTWDDSTVHHTTVWLGDQGATATGELATESRDDAGRANDERMVAETVRPTGDVGAEEVVPAAAAREVFERLQMASALSRRRSRNLLGALRASREACRALSIRVSELEEQSARISGSGAAAASTTQAAELERLAATVQELTRARAEAASANANSAAELAAMQEQLAAAQQREAEWDERLHEWRGEQQKWERDREQWEQRQAEWKQQVGQWEVSLAEHVVRIEQLERQLAEAQAGEAEPAVVEEKRMAVEPAAPADPGRWFTEPAATAAVADRRLDAPPSELATGSKCDEPSMSEERRNTSARAEDVPSWQSETSSWATALPTEANMVAPPATAAPADAAGRTGAGRSVAVEPTAEQQVASTIAASEASAREKRKPESYIERFAHLLSDDAMGPEQTTPPASVAGALATQTAAASSEVVGKPRNMPIVRGGSLPVGGSEDEESIEEYMAKLMQRVRGERPATRVYQPPQMVTSDGAASGELRGGVGEALVAPVGETGAAPAAELPVAERERATPPSVVTSDETAGGEGVAAPQELVRRTAPDQPINLEALRALANEQARHAIGAHATKKHRRLAATKFLVASLAGIASTCLMLTAPNWRGLQFIAACVALLIAAYWAGQSYRSLLELARVSDYASPSAERRPNEAEERNGQPPIDV